MKPRDALNRLAKHSETKTDSARISASIETCDNSYREILGAAAWARLKPEIRQRFSTKPTIGERILYSGVMHRVELTFMGWLFAQLCRLIGTPLAPYRGSNVPMKIELVWDTKNSGVAWDRTYYFIPDRRFTVRSTKSRSGDGNLVEHIGCGFSMRLALSEQGGNLVFSSTAYEFKALGLTVRIPALLTPGKTTVRHEQISGKRFRFSLSVEHPFLGRTIFQEGEFHSPEVSD